MPVEKDYHYRRNAIFKLSSFDNDYHYKEESVGVETTLDLIKTGQTCKVVKILGNGAIKRRIIDMGIVTGTEIKVQKYAPLGDPIEIKVKNFNLSLRKNEASLIAVEEFN